MRERVERSQVRVITFHKTENFHSQKNSRRYSDHVLRVKQKISSKNRLNFPCHMLSV